MNENKFTGKAELYSKYRPSYSEKLIDWLYEMTNAETVADIGAGTFETMGDIQVARLALTISDEDHSDLLTALEKVGVSAKERSL